MQDPAFDEQIVAAYSGERRASARVPTRSCQDLLSIAEITAHFSLHTEAAKARLHRARSLVRQCLSTDPALAPA
jgi:hypothetical protein